jgi:hypothetical protein
VIHLDTDAAEIGKLRYARAIVGDLQGDPRPGCPATAAMPLI